MITKCGQIQIEDSSIKGVYVISPAVHLDDRGYFIETFNERDMKEAGLSVDFVQDNESSSVKGVLRGLHFQKLFPQTKLVRVVSGTVFDVAVDIRKDSDTYGCWYGVILSEENKKQLYIEAGLAHGFLVLSEKATFCYKVTEFYHPNDEGEVAWNDPDIGIYWPEVTGEYRGSASAEGYHMHDGRGLLLSEKDSNAKRMRDVFGYSA